VETTPEWKSITSFRRVEERHSAALPKLPIEIGDFNKNRSVMSVRDITTTTAKECSGGATASARNLFGRPANRRNRLGVLTRRYLSSLDVTTGIFFSRVTRFQQNDCHYGGWKAVY
jgi:hypothetical protein